MNDDTPLFFKGHEGFYQIIKDNDIAKPGRAIRVYNYGGPSGNEMIYIIGTEKKLFDSRSGLEVKAEEVFSRKKAPDGWSVEGFAVDLLPESEIKKIMEREGR